MRQETSKLVGPARALRVFAAALALAAVVAGGAAPARANNDFQNGFEDQLGRIAAYSVTALGVRILTGGYYPAVAYSPPPVYVAPPVYYAPPPVYYAPPVVYAPRPVHYYGGPKKLKVRQVVYYPDRRGHGDWDHGPRGGHGWNDRGRGRGRGH